MSRFLPSYPTLEDANFQREINRKKEFDDLRLPVVEPQPQPGEYFSFQRLLARYVGPRTPYSRALLYLEPGVGKTCTANAIHETYKAYRGASFNRTLVLAKGKLLLDNYAQEYLNVCPGEGRGLGALERKRIIRKNFEFSPIQKFANNVINKMSAQTLKQRFSNRMIVIDEGQDLKKVGKGSLYESMLKFFDSLENVTIVIMSGTPIIEDAYEIVSLVNLLSEPGDRLPVGAAFYKRFYTDDGQFDKTKESELIEFFQGKISYIRQMGSVAKKTYVSQNQRDNWLERIRVYGCCMSPFQLEAYKKSRDRVDTVEVRRDRRVVSQKTQRGGAVYQYSLEASLFVFPDGTYGKEGFDKHIATKRQVRRGRKVTTETVYAIPDRWKTEFRTNLEKYSAKYAEIISLILNKSDECFFVFNDLVNNGGLVLLGLLLELHGFTRATQPVSASDPKRKRFIMLTSATPDAQAGRLIRAFSQPHNVRGEYVQVVLGSDVVSYGVTIKNLRNVVVAKPQWNWPSIEQIEARGIRPGSDAYLKQAGLPTDVSVYLTVAVDCKATGATTDVFLYQRTEEKLIRNEPMDQLTKRAAFDCPLAYARNVTDAKDNYRCATMAPTGRQNGIDTYTPESVDRTNYDQFYAGNDVAEAMDFLRDHFTREYEYSVLEGIRTFTEYVFLSALSRMIDERVPVTNARGEVCYVQEYNDVAYLQPRITDSRHLDTLTYMERPAAPYDTTVDALLDIAFIERDSTLQEDFCNTESVDEALDAFLSMNARTQIIVYESSYEFLQTSQGSQRQRAKAQRVVDEMSSQVYEFDGVVYHSMYAQRQTGTSYAATTRQATATGQMRRFVNGRFEWTPVDEETRINRLIKERERARTTQAFEGNPYGMYGTVSAADGKFRISTQPKVGKITKGLVCATSVPMPTLFKTLVTLDAYPPVGPNEKNLSREQLQKALLGHTKLTDNQIRDQIRAGDVSTDRMRQYLTALGMKTKDLCEFIRNEMEKRDILYNV